MKPQQYLWIIIGLILIGLTACGSQATGPQISVEKAWARASPKMAGAGAVYMTLKNSGGEADKLVSVETPAAEIVELHESFMDENEVMKMRPVEGGVIELPAGSSVSLEPGGLHVMLINLVDPLAVGNSVTLTLNFEKSEAIQVEAPVLEQAPD